MKKMIRACVVGAAVLLTGSVQAAPLLSAAGFGAGDTTVSLNEVPLDYATAVTNQFSHLGVTFSTNGSGAFYIGNGYQNSTNVSGQYLDSFAGDGGGTSIYAIKFNTVVDAAGSFWEFNPSTNATFSAFLHGALVESFNYFNVDCCNSASFIGFGDINFNEIQVSQITGGAFYMDSVLFSPASDIPEPASMALFGIAAAGFAAARRRRQTSKQ
jgi:hypothetical protein